MSEREQTDEGRTPRNQIAAVQVSLTRLYTSNEVIM